MDAWVWIVIALLLLAVIAYLLWKRRRTQAVSSRYGNEYERTVTEEGSNRKAVSEIKAREKHRADLDIRPLPPASRERYMSSWSATQVRFVDAPVESVGEADRLVQEVMRERGYPVDDFDQRADDISVDHPYLVEDFRAAHGISLASQHDQASTEDLRQAIVHYRSLFEELLETGDGSSSEERETS